MWQTKGRVCVDWTPDAGKRPGRTPLATRKASRPRSEPRKDDKSSPNARRGGRIVTIATIASLDRFQAKPI
jgi:hypothetical protein